MIATIEAVTMLSPLRRPISHEFWVELRTLIGEAAGYDRHESGNEVKWSLPFERIDGFEKSDLQKIQNDLGACFGRNGVAPPLPLWLERVKDFEARAAIWLFHRPSDEAEAIRMLREFNNRRRR